MSSQRVWRNGSPSTSKQGPIKAVKVFSLKQGKAASSSKTTSSPSPRDSHKLRSHRLSPERKSPGGAHSPSHIHKDKTKTPRLSPVPGKWRASSADTVVPSCMYMTGQWPKDITNYHHYQSDGVFMCDKATQTVDEWVSSNEKKQKGHRRSASFGQGDQLKLQFFKHHLQKSKEGSKNSDGKQRSSPVQGNHAALSLTAPAALCAQQTKAILISAGHIPRQSMNRYQRSSVEGHNMEIEKLVSAVKMVTVSSSDGEEKDSAFKLEIPDGHRAPGPDMSRLSSTRSVDTQTPSSLHDSGLGILVSSLVRPASISPETAPRAGSLSARLAVSRSGSDSADSKSSKETSPELMDASPKLGKSCPFVREPPDGCEKVTVVDENRHPLIKEPMLFSPVKPNQFVFKQSQGSAFCPLIKSYFVDSEFPVDFSNQTTPTLPTEIEG
ncbi:protein fam117b [Plakobranchus ocellatus]|uniref:Protein fam117b n=1 Tax=Plakobranchus ocellatus TaxID=259542 RepID=A0AAV4D1H7_9GAST|nr:protein fam117b [Plakobranchus ocellatus]